MLATCLAGCGNGRQAEPTLVIDTGVVDVGMIVDAGLDASAPDGAADTVEADMEPDVAGPPPEVPAGLVHWLTGDPDDVSVQPLGPGLILMGGGTEPDDAFRWWIPLLAGGDVVVLRVSGSDGYNDYLYTDIGGVNSVETLKVDSRVLADAPYVAYQIDHAEGVFLAGGDQWDYLSLWSGTATADALQRVHERGAVLGGTSAGLAVLGERAFSAENDTVYSEEALRDPYNEFMRFEDEFLSLGPLRSVVTDSHFAERDRMGRLVAFVARMVKDGFVDPVGLGVDESTALLLGPQGRSVVGQGAVYEVVPMSAPEVCEPGQPLEWTGIGVTRTRSTGSDAYVISASAGELDPSAPY